jgi:hypothetical protein
MDRAAGAVEACHILQCLSITVVTKWRGRFPFREELLQVQMIVGDDVIFLMVMSPAGDGSTR